MEEYRVEEREAPGRGKVKVLIPIYEPGKPEGEEVGKWTRKLTSREEILRYLRTAERYWHTPPSEWYGSEKRKTPA